MQQIVHRQRKRLSDMAVNFERNFGRIDGRGNIGEVPANVEAVIGCENALVKDFERCLQQGWPSPLQNHRALLREVRDQFTPTIREGQLDEAVGPGRPVGGAEQAREADSTCAR
jgi:hypothetical protein